MTTSFETLEINATTKFSPIEIATESREEDIELDEYDGTQEDVNNIISEQPIYSISQSQATTNLSDTMVDDISCPSDNTFAEPILISEFKSHVERLHASRDKHFELEYTVN